MEYKISKLIGLNDVRKVYLILFGIIVSAVVIFMVGLCASGHQVWGGGFNMEYGITIAPQKLTFDMLINYFVLIAFLFIAGYWVVGLENIKSK